MSEIKTKLQNDIKETMKARNQAKLTMLRGLSSAIKQVEVDTRTELDDAAVMSIFQKEIKKRKDALQFAKDAGRSELVEQNETEIKLIQSYLGEQLGGPELRALIQTIVDGGAKAIGQVMGELNKGHKGKFDGREASEIVKELLGG
jgi:uncharacterized protein YqeY